MERKDQLTAAFQQRITLLPPEIYRRLAESSQVVLFGSFAVGLQGPSSDLDIFSVGEQKTHYKSKAIEVMILPEHESYSDLWLGSELANHIKAYGICIGEQSQWFPRASIGAEAFSRKSRRVSSYLRALTMHWEVLTPRMKIRYETKIRRELQRLDLIAHGEPTPPTKILDDEFDLAGTLKDSCLRMLSSDQLKGIRDLFPSLLTD